jgi:hypothetical protein
MHTGTVVPHALTDGVRVLAEGILQYDVFKNGVADE